MMTCQDFRARPRVIQEQKIGFCCGWLTTSTLGRFAFFQGLAGMVVRGLLFPPRLMRAISNRFLFAILPVFLLSQCAPPVLKNCASVPRASRVPSASLIEEARAYWGILGNASRKSEWAAARDRYNAAVGKLFDQIRCGRGSWDDRAALIATRIQAAGRDQVDPNELDALVPASTIEVTEINRHNGSSGLGLPVVGWKSTSPVGMKRERYLLPNGLPYNITAVLAFDRKGMPTWQFNKRWAVEQTRVGGHSHLLAADWSAPNDFYWKMCDLGDLAVQNVLLPDRFSEETGLYFVTPYDPNKIPVVLVHGLVSSPDAFKNVINELSPEPWFRENYQIWLYNYPTGNPWIYSSMKFREMMREACDYARSKGGGAKLNRMVIVGHSMGGLVTRSSVTDPGQKLYKALFNKPIDELKASDSTMRLIRDGTLYKPLREPKRVVFLAVPHRGSPMANLFFSNWASKLIKLPKTLAVDLLDATFLTVGDIAKGEDSNKRLPTSIDSLSQNAPATVALSNLPLPKNITFHSVIGDRGKGDSPKSSDGVVPYWSSHVTPVASELIVPSNHSVPNNLQASEELKRILKLHLKSNH
jgi:pimeloyl-ACP methyl ester carboxylesterase